MERSTDAAELESLRGLVATLRAALDLKQARADYRDAAKRETAALLGLPASAGIHEILGAIRALVDERDRLRQLVGVGAG